MAAAARSSRRLQGLGPSEDGPKSLHEKVGKDVSDVLEADAPKKKPGRPAKAGSAEKDSASKNTAKARIDITKIPAKTADSSTKKADKLEHATALLTLNDDRKTAGSDTDSAASGTNGKLTKRAAGTKAADKVDKKLKKKAKKITKKQAQKLDSKKKHSTVKVVGRVAIEAIAKSLFEAEAYLELVLEDGAWFQRVKAQTRGHIRKARRAA